MNVLDKKVSFFKTVGSRPTEIDLLEFLDSIKMGRFRNKIEGIRQTDDKKIRQQYKQDLPCCTVSGTFSDRKASTLIQHSGLVCIDIDAEPNKDIANFSEMKQLISAVKYVAYCAASAGGSGYFCIIPIKYPERHAEQFDSLAKDFARCGIIVDTQCRDIIRKRFMSYDPEPYVNESAEVYPYCVAGDEVHISSLESGRSNGKRVGRTGKLTDEERTKVLADVDAAVTEAEVYGWDLTEGYDNWFNIGVGLANDLGEEGRDLYHRISQFNAGYSIGDCDRKYSDCIKALEDPSYKHHTVATFFKYYHDRRQQEGLETKRQTAEEDFSSIESSHF